MLLYCGVWCVTSHPDVSILWCFYIVVCGVWCVMAHSDASTPCLGIREWRRVAVSDESFLSKKDAGWLEEEIRRGGCKM
jgi:hypothetical protein